MLIIIKCELLFINYWTMRNIQKITVVLLSIFILASCGRNLVTGKSEFSLMSTNQEVALGKESDPQIVASFGLYEDNKLQQFFNERGQQMAKESHRPGIEYEFKVLDSPVINAFAVPGGYVYFTRGILTHFNNEAELMGVLGHEIGHIVHRHSAKQYTNQVLTQLGMAVGMIVSPQFRKFADVANTGMSLMLLKFGRDAEKESDELGVAYSTMQGYNAHEMANFFKTLDRMRKESGQVVPDFLSTHPNPADRFTKVNELTVIEQKKDSHQNYKVNRDQYLKMIDGIVYGEDPRQGFVENNVFYHPELKIQFDIPENWELVNAPNQVQMAPKDKKGFMVMSFAPGSSLSDAKAQIIKRDELNVLQSRNTKVNGLDAIVMTSEQEQKNQQGEVQQTLRILTYIISYNGAYYLFHGLALKEDFNKYLPMMKKSMKSFKVLKDASKINKKPIRLDIVKVKKTGTLKSALLGYKMKNEDLETLSLLNGMQLSDQVNKNSLIKTFTTKNPKNRP